MLLNQVCLHWSRFPAAIQISHYTAHPSSQLCTAQANGKLSSPRKKCFYTRTKKVDFSKKSPVILYVPFNFDTWLHKGKTQDTARLLDTKQDTELSLHLLSFRVTFPLSPPPPQQLQLNSDLAPCASKQTILLLGGFVAP